jgi:hypothetical protein
MTNIATLITEARIDLDDTDEKQHTDAEMLSYYNKWARTIYDLLVIDKSELVTKGSATLTTTAGMSGYTFASISASDFWAPYRVWIAGYDPMRKVNEDEYLDYEQTDGTLITGQPDRFYIEGSSIYLLPEPDAVYTVKIKYWPSFTKAEADYETVPFLDIFNQQLVYGMTLSGKHRLRGNPSIETAMMQLQQDIGMEIMRMRRKTVYQFSPVV